MALIVMKFGGTSVANATKIKTAAAKAIAAKRAGHQVVMVVSARGHKTDELVDLAAEISDNPPPREMDMLLSTGEQESVALVAMAVQAQGEQAISMTGGQMGVWTDSTHTKARIQKIDTGRMKRALDEGKIVIAAGFQGIDQDMNITTLGRGGSDTTATALAAVLAADECQVYTDVEGVFTTDPRIVKTARKVQQISYDEMLELASLGAGVMHSRSIEFAKKYRVNFRVRPSYTDGDGTLITNLPEENAPVAIGVALARDEVRISISDIPDKPGVLSVIFSRMAARKIPIDMVVQDISAGGLAEVTFTVPKSDMAEALTAAQEATEELEAGSVNAGANLSKVSLVGSGMRTHTGVAAQMFQSLSDKEINIAMVTTSEIKTSVLVARDRCDEAVIAVHDGFALQEVAARIPPIGIKRREGEKTDRATLEREVVSRLANMEDIVVSQIDLDTTQSRVTIANLPDQPGILTTLFAAVAEGGVMVDMIVQNISHSGHAKVSFTVPREDLQSCLMLLTDVLEEYPDAKLAHEQKIAKLSVTGIGLRSHTGVGDKMFRALAEANINVKLVNTSEILISVVIALEEGDRAKAALLQAFRL